MSIHQLWLDLALSPTKTIRDYFRYCHEHGQTPDRTSLTRFFKRINIPQRHSERHDLIAWLSEPDQGFLPYPDLPGQLRQLKDPPAGLFYQGDEKLINERMIAVVGARKQTPAGAENCQQFAYQLAQSGLVIISGLASGADTTAHTAALAASERTVAILGQGLDTCYPKSNSGLQGEIKRKGLLLSEYAPSESVKAWQFPHRNRLISGLSDGVLVTEATIRSGSLITANLAAEQGKQVFAIPGDIQNQMVSGCHHLIREGAQLVSHPREILAAIYWTEPPQLELLRTEMDDKQFTKSEKKVLDALDRTPRHLDIIQARTECELTLVLDALFSLELKGMIISSIDGYYKPNQGDTC